MSYKNIEIFNFRCRTLTDEEVRSIKEIGCSWYKFNCKYCEFKGVSEGALDIHVRFKHPDGE